MTGIASVGISTISPATPPPQPKQLPTLTLEDVRRKGWRYLGYSRFSSWLASDNDFFVTRRFDTITARVILLMQWEITDLETQLVNLDFKLSRLVVKDIHNGRFGTDIDERLTLLRNIKEKLTEYHSFINTYSELRAKPDATADNIANVKNWLERWKGAIDPKEASVYTQDHGDLAPIVSTNRTPLRRVFEKLDAFRSSDLFRRHPGGLREISTKESKDSTTKGSSKINDPAVSPDQYDPNTTIYQDSDSVDSFVNATICIVGFIMLAAPLWILFYIPSRQNQLIVITVFIAFFLGIMQSVSVAKPFESVAATAGYSAVLMVFMQIGPQNAAS